MTELYKYLPIVPLQIARYNSELFELETHPLHTHIVMKFYLQGELAVL